MAPNPEILYPREMNVDGLHEANGGQAASVGATGPAALGTLTVSAWFKVKYQGTTYYIPMWT